MASAAGWVACGDELPLEWRGGSRVATSRQLDEEDGEALAAFDREESELELESEDEALDEESLDGDEPLEAESFEEDDAASFSLRRPWAMEPWSFL